MSTTYTKELPLQRHATGSLHPRVEVTEWTPESKGHEPIRSNWPSSFIGKKLTNARVLYYARMGRYGEDAKRRAIAAVVERSGEIRYCQGPGCNEFVNVRYMRWAYLPAPGYYCPRCREHHKNEREKEREAQRTLRTNAWREYE